ncbi:DUF4365 domain-containing protein [Lacipirellula sp.]|uniref:DUF4365 domain-containing protein n=1 Tax=Lacipirellula sp. TaxID=2691419 RepID=UPI003D150F91
MSLDDLPARDSNSELAALAESVFELAVAELAQFAVQKKDRNDYGSDFQLEAQHSGGMTNYRVHVQLKGTRAKGNRDGSVSVSIARKNLNYLLRQAHSIYVCYHEPTKGLLVRTAESVFREVGHQHDGGQAQNSLTIRFAAPFDHNFQAALHARTVAASTTLRDDRLQWIMMEPDHFYEKVIANVPSITVPEAPEEAFICLESLFNQGQDEVISKAFGQFAAALGLGSSNLIYAYLSEINLAMRHRRFDRSRVQEAILFLEKIEQDPAGVLYCQANGYSALGQIDNAKRYYRQAIEKLGGQNPHLEAMCWKNLGTAIEQEGDQAEACKCYESAIRHEPQLMEAHMALALARVKVHELDSALKHFR